MRKRDVMDLKTCLILSCISGTVEDGCAFLNLAQELKNVTKFFTLTFYLRYQPPPILVYTRWFYSNFDRSQESEQWILR